ncbi:MAG: helix-turn-helix domain-containing protein [Clostridiaceae bacterium]
MGTMPRRSRLKLPPLGLKESVGRRLARLRKEKGYTQVELAAKVGIIQSLVTDYELDKLRLHAEMVIRFAKALGVSADELLGLAAVQSNGTTKNRRVLRRVNQIDQLPKRDQDALLRTIDAFLGKGG